MQHSLGTLVLVLSITVYSCVLHVGEAVYQEMQHSLGTMVLVLSITVYSCVL